MLADIDFYKVDKSAAQKLRLRQSQRLFFSAHSDGLYTVNLYRNVGKAAKLLNSADFESFSYLYCEKNVDKLYYFV